MQQWFFVRLYAFTYSKEAMSRFDWKKAKKKPERLRNKRKRFRGFLLFFDLFQVTEVGEA